MSRSAYGAHVKFSHGRSWRCCFQCSHTFSSKADFEHHMRAEHSTQCKSKELTDLADMCEKHVLPEQDINCPLCRMEVRPARAMYRHISMHLEDIALMSIEPKSSRGNGDTATGGEASSSVPGNGPAPSTSGPAPQTSNQDVTSSIPSFPLGSDAERPRDTTSSHAKPVPLSRPNFTTSFNRQLPARVSTATVEPHATRPHQPWLAGILGDNGASAIAARDQAVGFSSKLWNVPRWRTDQQTDFENLEASQSLRNGGLLNDTYNLPKERNHPPAAPDDNDSAISGNSPTSSTRATYDRSEPAGNVRFDFDDWRDPSSQRAGARRSAPRGRRYVQFSEIRLMIPKC